MTGSSNTRRLRENNKIPVGCYIGSAMCFVILVPLLFVVFEKNKVV